MANHTDVRAMFYGTAENVKKMMRAQRLSGMVDQEMLAFAQSKEAQAGELPRQRRDSRQGIFIEPAKKGIFGFMPPVEVESFSFEVATPMPKELDVEKGSDSMWGQAVMEGRWEEICHYPAMAELAKAKDKADAMEIMERIAPGALEKGKARVDNVEKYGCADWYDWSCQRWGTKWDAYGVSWEKTKDGGKSVLVKMNTAWSPPIPALVDLCAMFNLRCSCIAIDEGGGYSVVVNLGKEGVQSEFNEDNARKLGAHQMASIKAWDAVAKKDQSDAERIQGAKRAKLELVAWPAVLARGEPLSESAFGEGAPKARSVEAVDAMLEALGEKAALGEDQALAALDELKRRGVLDAGDATSTGGCLGEVFAQALWLRGALWAVNANPSSDVEGKVVGAMRLAAVAKNDEDALRVALEREPSWMPADESMLPPACRMAHIERLQGERRVEACKRLAGDIEAQAKAQGANGHMWSGLQRAIDMLPRVASMMEKAQLQGEGSSGSRGRKNKKGL